jgi:uncharacterized protein YbaR (Trm112 family)
VRRLLEITVCPREKGRVSLAVERGGRPVRMNARALVGRLERLIARRGLAGRVRIRQECAGGCDRAGPNLHVDVFAEAPAGVAQDRVAVRARSYVYCLASSGSLARIVEENLRDRP